MTWSDLILCIFVDALIIWAVAGVVMMGGVAVSLLLAVPA